jgi:hypothetical protein
MPAAEAEGAMMLKPLAPRFALPAFVLAAFLGLPQAWQAAHAQDAATPSATPSADAAPRPAIRQRAPRSESKEPVARQAARPSQPTGEAQRRAAAAATAALAAKATAGLAATPAADATAEPPNPAAQATAPPPAPAKPRGPARADAVADAVATAASPADGGPESAQLLAADRVHYGSYQCEGRQALEVERDPGKPGYVQVRMRRQAWLMKPVASDSGAVRLEDVKGEALLVQIPIKSMLMNVRTGQRMLDGCLHELQRAASREPAGPLTLLK